MTPRLTAEREAQIRCHADAHKPCDDDFHALLAELDALRAERDSWKQDYWVQNGELDRAGATLAAIRAWAMTAVTSLNMPYVDIANHMHALLDAAPKETP